MADQVVFLDDLSNDQTEILHKTGALGSRPLSLNFVEDGFNYSHFDGDLLFGQWNVLTGLHT